MTKPEFNIYQESSDHYDAILSPEYIDLCYMPVRRLIEQELRPAGSSLLDLCCGTGIMAELSRDLPGLNYLGVDINREFLRRARERMAGLDRFQFVEADFFTFDLSRKFDIILMINGYHHFENHIKSPMLQKVHDLLESQGGFILYEMIIAPHQTQKEFSRANEELYRKRIEWVKQNEPMDSKKLKAWENVCDLSASAEDEYKVDYDYVIRDIENNGFRIDDETRIWPPPGEQIFQEPQVGDFLFLLRK